jgi:quercetin dioxygenase-like cupin family protein
MSFTLTSPRPGIPPTPAAAPTPATGLRFFCPPAGAFADWHPAPRRQFNFIVAGTVEVEVSDGAVRRFEPGSVLLLEDTEGQGHRTRVVGDAHGCFAAVPLAAE